VAERETLLAQLTALVESMDGEFESRSSSRARGTAVGGGVMGRNVSTIVINLVWTQAVRSKV
jgi:hypothetical protein